MIREALRKAHFAYRRQFAHGTQSLRQFETRRQLPWRSIYRGLIALYSRNNPTDQMAGPKTNRIESSPV